MENSAHTWRLKIFKLVFVYAHRLFCYPPAQKKFFARAKRARSAREKLFSFPTVLGVQDWRVPSFLPNALQTLEGRFPFPAALFFKFFYPRRPRRTPLQLDTYAVSTFHICPGIVHEHIFLAKSCQKVPKKLKDDFPYKYSLEAIE